MTKLPEEESFEREIVNHLFAHLTEADRDKVFQLFDHAFDHPWADEGLKRSIVQNICKDFDVEVPEEYDGDSFDSD